MGITSLKNKISKRVTQKQERKDYQEVGAFIKKRRKDLNLTQDIISNGICSISYLSKIENGQIQPNEFFVKEIMQKLEVEEDFLKKNLEDRTYLENTIKCFFYNDSQGLTKLFEEVKDIDDNLTINICKFGYLVYKYQKLNSDYVMGLENLVMNMNDIELLSYLLFSALYFISHDDYKTALELLLYMDEFGTKNEYLFGLCHEYTYYVKQRLLKKNSSTINFNESYRVYTKYLNTNRAMNLVLNKIMYLGYENPRFALLELETVKVTLLDGFNLDFYYYIKSQILFRLNCLNEAVIALKNINEESDLYTGKMVLLYEICVLEEDYDMMNEIKLILKSSKQHSINIKDKVYYHYLIQKDESKKDYIKDIAIPFSIKTSDYQSLKLYVNSIMDICIENSRYKEATQYYKKYQKELHKVEKILYK